MARVGIELPPGLTSDDTPYSKQGTFRNADNVRFYMGKAEVVKGYERISLSSVTGVCRNLLPWKDNLGSSLIALSTNATLNIWKAGSLVDITPVGYVAGNIDGGVGTGFGTGAWGKGAWGEFSAVVNDYYPKTWALSNFGQSLIASPRYGEIYWWQNDTTAKATKLRSEAGADSVPQITLYTLVTKERQVLALGCDEELTPGVLNGLCIRGSDIDGNLTDWHTSNANNAFEYILPNGGSIIAGRIWGDDVAIWTQGGMYQGTFVGDPALTYQFTAVDGALGLLGPNAAVVKGRTAYWLSTDMQLWACDVGGIPVKLPCPIFDDTLAFVSSSQGDKVIVSYNPIKDELRIDYPDSRDGLENSRYLAVSLADGAWSRGTACRTAFHRGTSFKQPIAAEMFTRNSVVVSDFYYEEFGESADGDALSWSLETNDFAFDEDFTSMFIRGFIPDFIGQKGDVSLTVYVRMYPQDEEQEFGPYTITPGQDRVDFMVQGKLARFKIEGSSNPAAMRLGRPIFDVVPAGTR